MIFLYNPGESEQIDIYDPDEVVRVILPNENALASQDSVLRDYLSYSFVKRGDGHTEYKIWPTKLKSGPPGDVFFLGAVKFYEDATNKVLTRVSIWQNPRKKQ